MSNVGQTSDRHSHKAKNTDPSDTEVPSEIIRKHNEILQKKLELIIRGEIQEARTSKIEFRTWPDLKYVYGKAPKQVKTAARRAFENVIIAWFLNKEQLESVSSGSPIIINLNMNLNENSNNVNINIDKEALSDVLSLLETLMTYVRKVFPPSSQRVIYQRYRKAVKTIEGLLSLN